MDDRKQRVIVNCGQRWRRASTAGKSRTRRRSMRSAASSNGPVVAVARGSRALAGERRVRDLFVFNDPIGNRLEAFYGAEVSAAPFRPGRSISGFRTGPLGMGHAVLTVERLDGVSPSTVTCSASR
jgi:hypothetical protein